MDGRCSWPVSGLEVITFSFLTSLSQRYSFASAFQHCNRFNEELSLPKVISLWLTGLLVSQSLLVNLLPSDCVTRISSKKNVQIYYD